MKIHNIKKIYKYLLVVFLLGCSPEVEVGQKWEYCYNEDNPFKKPECELNTVLKVEKGWVQYVNTRGFTRESSIEWFLIGSELK